MAINPMWKNYPDLSPELTAVQTLMQDSIHTTDSQVTKAILTLINSGGKLLRPAYCLLFSRYQTADRERMIAIAAAIETMHTATLIHDDVVDEADTRRQAPTISAKFGKNVAVYAGDYLFVVVFKILAKYGQDMQSIELNGDSMEKVLTGEINQMSMRYNLKMTIPEYLKQINGKTAQLFALACSAGAYESGSTEKFAKKAQQIGLALGTAFQVVDDILDYSSNQATLGKPVHEDMRQGVYSAPLIFALEKDESRLTTLLNKKLMMTSADTAQVVTLVQELGGLTAAKKMAAKYTDEALKLIYTLPPNKTTATIERLTREILGRTN